MKKIKNNGDLQYANWVKALIDLIKPHKLYLYGGRGVAKSVDIIASRAIDVIYDMPGGCFVFVSDTYANLMSNIIPAVIYGWEHLHKFYENKHFVVDRPPWENWDRPLIKTFNYKHTISTFNGCKFFLTSLDRPSINAGISAVHHFGDEAKYLKESKLKKLTPTLRGDAKLFSHSHFFLGHTFCSDMANPFDGEDDWMLKMEKHMDQDQIKMILQTAFVVNDILIELYEAKESNASANEIANIEKKLERWQERIRKVRQDSVLFYIVSSFANADILTIKYFKNLFDTLSLEEFKTAVLSLKRTVAKGERFYGNLSEHHFYGDGYNYKFYDKHGLLDNIQQSSRGLKHIQHKKHLEAGFDAGNMMSLVVGQEHNPNYRILKNIYTITPEWIEELAKKFTDFFQHHQSKQLHLYYDRAANQYRKAGQDLASKLKLAIEYRKEGNRTIRTGWHVILKSIGQGNVSHVDEFDLMNVIMGDKDYRLPKLLIDQYECKELKSQLELARVTKDRNGNIKKDKSSDKLPMKRLPLESVNLTDAFKYLMCRKNYLNILKARQSSMGDPKVRN